MTTSLNPFPKGFLKETFQGPKKKTNRDLSCEERVDEYLADRLQDIKEFAQEGFSSDDFFEMVDQRIRQELPNKFKEAAEESEEATPKKPRQTVAGQSRSSASAKKVKLNQEDIRLAKKWGIALEKYAVNKAQMEKANGDYTTIT